MRRFDLAKTWRIMHELFCEKNSSSSLAVEQDQSVHSVTSPSFSFHDFDEGALLLDGGFRDHGTVAGAAAAASGTGSGEPTAFELDVATPEFSLAGDDIRLGRTARYLSSFIARTSA